MKSFDYEAYTTADGECYCCGCIAEDTAKDELYPIFADSEWDSYPVCAKCGEEHTYVSLTSEGVARLNEDRISCLIDGAAGIYVPQRFAETYDLQKWGLDPLSDDVAILRAGPDHEYYWEAWENTLNNAAMEDKDGNTWTLYQDSDLFARRDDYIEE